MLGVVNRGRDRGPPCPCTKIGAEREAKKAIFPQYFYLAGALTPTKTANCAAWAPLRAASVLAASPFIFAHFRKGITIDAAQTGIGDYRTDFTRKNFAPNGVTEPSRETGHVKGLLSHQATPPRGNEKMNADG